MRNIITLLLIFLFFLSCTAKEGNYQKIKLQETEDGRIIFETYNYKEPIGTFHLFMITDYALRIIPFQKNLIDVLINKWTIEYNIYDSSNKIKYVTNNINVLADVLKNELPNDIKIYEYIITTSWMPNDSYDETIRIIKEICKLNNIEFIQNNPRLQLTEEDYIDTFWCIHCMTFIP
jgi:hypothetical protein